MAKVDGSRQYEKLKHWAIVQDEILSAEGRVVKLKAANLNAEVKRTVL
jgi:hypothetical protein